MSKARDSFQNRWAIPVAALVPVLACVFAFSLGPSPHKHVFDYERHAGPPAERLQALEAAGSATWSVLLEAAKRPDCAHRAEALEFLVTHDVVGARAVLERIANNADEPKSLRNHARQLLDRHPMARAL